MLRCVCFVRKGCDGGKFAYHADVWACSKGRDPVGRGMHLVLSCVC
mgnify:CR=1 FL=1